MNIRKQNMITLAVERARSANNWADCDVIQEAIEQCEQAKTEEEGRVALTYLKVAIDFRANLIPDKKDIEMIAHYRDDFFTANLSIDYSDMRKKYLNGDITHREYYASIAKMAGVRFEEDNRLVQACKVAKDQEHYNGTGLPLGVFEIRSEAINKAFKAHGDFWSQAGSVCLIKEAIKQAIERN